MKLLLKKIFFNKLVSYALQLLDLPPKVVSLGWVEGEKNGDREKAQEFFLDSI